LGVGGGAGSGACAPGLREPGESYLPWLIAC
jgi:hypothetical protein